MNPELDDGRRIAKIYFQRGFEVLAKDLAASIRNQRSHAHLIDQKNFESENNVLDCDACLIQASAPNARKIGRAYSSYGAPGTEVLFFDDEGRITKLDLVEPATSFATLLGGGTDEKADSASNEPAPDVVLEKPARNPAGKSRKSAGSADTEEGNSAQDADNTDS